MTGMSGSPGPDIRTKDTKRTHRHLKDALTLAATRELQKMQFKTHFSE